VRKLRFHEQTVYRRIRRGEIPSYKDGSTVRVYREWFDAQEPADPSADYVERLLAEAGPLSEEQRTKLAEILSPIRSGGAA
jgi:excisionase family DNA binding protein